MGQLFKETRASERQITIDWINCLARQFQILIQTLGITIFNHSTRYPLRVHEKTRNRKSNFRTASIWRKTKDKCCRLLPKRRPKRFDESLLPCTGLAWMTKDWHLLLLLSRFEMLVSSSRKGLDETLGKLLSIQGLRLSPHFSHIFLCRQSLVIFNAILMTVQGFQLSKCDDT